MARVTSFSSRPNFPLAPVSIPPWPGSMTTVFIPDFCLESAAAGPRPWNVSPAKAPKAEVNRTTTSAGTMKQPRLRFPFFVIGHIQFQFSQPITGGGGGNRTRVRRNSTRSVYMLIPFHILIPRCSKRKSSAEPAPSFVSLAGFRAEPVRYPAELRSMKPHGRGPPERRAFLLGRDC